MFVEANLSRKQYDIVRNTKKQVYPCYSFLQKAKLDCYPEKDSYNVTESCAEIQLQPLLNHTATRLLLYLEDLIDRLDNDEIESLVLISKWGCDGSHQSQYKQKFDTDTSGPTILTYFKVHWSLFNYTVKKTKRLFGKIQHHLRLDIAVQSAFCLLRRVQTL